VDWLQFLIAESGVETGAMSDGWDESAQAWIASQGDAGDFGRRYVLDGPMTARVAALGSPLTALDVGCGEGRFCRILQGLGVATVGVDPTAVLIDHARALDPAGDYRVGKGEALDLADGAFDLVVSYLSLIDIPDIRVAIPEMARVLKPGGTLLIANSTSFNTAGLGEGLGKSYDAEGRFRYVIDAYLEERAYWTAWKGIRIVNHHRPLETYMSLLLGAGLTLTHFAEPAPTGGDPATVDRYRRAPWFHVMEWRKGS
jgi:SAM-dependent methyltransferase